MTDVVFAIESFFTVLAVLGLIGATYVCWQAWYYLILLRPALERDLGFREGSASLPAKNWNGYISAVAIEKVADDGLFAQAGFRTGDVLPDVSHIELFKLLHRNRGKVVELAIVDAGPGLPFRLRPRRLVRFTLPRKARAGKRGHN